MTSPAAFCARSPKSSSTGPTRRSRISLLRASATSRMPGCGAALPSPARASGNEARDHFKGFDSAMAALPLELQRLAMKEALARGDRGAGLYRRRHGCSTSSRRSACRPNSLPAIDVLRGRLAEGLGRKDDALKQYRAAVASNDRRAAAQGRLREIELLSATRRDAAQGRDRGAGDAHHGLARRRDRDRRAAAAGASLHVEGRYRDAFHVMRTALLAHPELGHHAQDPGRGGGDLRQRCSSAARATRCRRSRRSACSTIFAS